MTALFDPAEHEPLCAQAWDEDAARTFVARIVREADDAFDPVHGWQNHPEDDDGAGRRFGRGIYNGGAGTILAAVRLAARNGIALRNDYAAEIVRCEDAYRADPYETNVAVPSYFIGTVGIILARYAITGEPAMLERLAGERGESDARSPLGIAGYGDRRFAATRT